MSYDTNPYYNPPKGWDMVQFDQEDLCYEYDTLVFWKTPNGVFYAEDSGCSCPTPFEDYAAKTPEEIEAKLQRVGSKLQVDSIFQSWNATGYKDAPKKIPFANAVGDIMQIESWFND